MILLEPPRDACRWKYLHILCFRANICLRLGPLLTFQFAWTLTAELQRRIQAMEMRFYRRILRISHKDHVTNEEVRAKIQQAIGLLEDPTTVK